MIAASYFDGRSARAHPVHLFVRNGNLTLVGAEHARQVPVAQLRLLEPFEQAAAVLELPDATHCEVADDAGRRALAQALAYRPSRVERWQANWPAALAALAGLAVGLVLAWSVGIPAAAERIAAAIPESMDQRLGDTAQAALEHNLLQPSRFSRERIARLRAVFDRTVPANTRMPLRLIVRQVPNVGPNAFALPNGTIVLTDDMVKLLLPEGGDIGDIEDGLAGVFAHEIGHVQKRHSVRALAQSSLTLGASWALFGDFSAVASALPALATNMKYSRAMETEADDYAVALLRAHDVPVAAYAGVFESLRAELRRKGVDEEALPPWMRASLGYLSSHPSSAERIARLRGQAGPGR